ncbi:NACHT, LRR and PYD domains-containing protein 12-like [Cololabis saira]|uniref:NACHT, LRR and PYD domains-containing protein 12-like n=1 Tax=Cololabis saira TaxID=129043 RepID=UPI002AD40178|nr:NACHT, LRR and PYD domains-containing protein 12-like [Cololabis saira]
MDQCEDETVPLEQKRGQGAQSSQLQTHDDETSQDQDDSREVMTSRSDNYTEVKWWLKDTLESLDSRGLEEFQWCLVNADESQDGFNPIPVSYLENANRLKTVDLMMQRFSSKTREVAETILKKMKKKTVVQEDPVSPAGATGMVVEVCKKLKSKLQKKYQCVSEGIIKAGKKILLDKIYTELYITEGGTGEVNEEHEIRYIEAVSRKPERAETTIRQEDIFKPPPGRGGSIRMVMTKGVAGIGKTVLTQKFSLDWAEGRTNQEIQFLLPFTFRELNVLREEKFSLVELVHLFFSETRTICSFEELQVVFIFDGLDECRLPLDFHNSTIVSDPRRSTSVDVLLTNLIRGKLLPSARLWITTRPAAANQIPPEFDYVDMVTEVRGFTDPQKEEYFRKRFREEEQNSRIISHIKTSRSLHIMCHIPVFCWITATVLENVLENVLETREGGELPKTLTEMYTHFLVVQVKLNKVKYDGGAATDPHWSLESRKMIKSLGKLAFEQLQKGNLIFYKKDLRECGIDIREASVYSGVFTQIFREESNLYQDQVFCFIHLSVQEFLAALHVHRTFIKSGVNLLEKQKNIFRWFEKIAVTKLHQTAVDKSLQSPNGHLDLFLRFLLGLSVDTNQTLLQGLLKPKQRSSQNNQETVKYIKKKISEELSAERSINLFHCLNELNDRSLVKEVQEFLRSGRLSTDELSPAQWSALVFILLSSGDLEEFDLKKFSASEQVLQRLLPVVKASKKVVLSGCNLSGNICPLLSSVLSSQSSSLTELDLSYNHLQDSGLKKLCPGLESPHCHLESLRLSGCLISEEGSSSLVSALTSNPSHLRELDLSNNDLQDSGLKQLCPGLESPHCQLESLRLNDCHLLGNICPLLSSVLSSQSSSLTELDLSNNDLWDSGLEQLCPGLESPHCKLESLRLSGCLISEEGSSSLVSALNSNPSHLRELDLSYNHPGESAGKLLSRLENPRWRLDTLRVEPAGQRFLTPGLRKYSCQLTVDTNTVNNFIKLSDKNRKMTSVGKNQSYPDHPDRFGHLHRQLLCREVLTGRCYWEVQWSGEVSVSVSHRRISREGGSADCMFGGNDHSWRLDCSPGHQYRVLHNNRETSITSSSPSPDSGIAAVYVDVPAGTLSFYEVVSDRLIHLHTFNTSFSGPLYAGFRLYWPDSGSSVSLCPV